MTTPTRTKRRALPEPPNPWGLTPAQQAERDEDDRRWAEWSARYSRWIDGRITTAELYAP